MADGSVILAHTDDIPNPLTFMILDADGTIIRSITKPDGYYFSSNSILALKNGNFVFVFKTEIMTIVFEIYDQFLNLIKGATTVKFSDSSTNDISNQQFDATIFKLNNNGFGIIYLRDDSIQYINFYDQNGNFISNSPETFPLARGYYGLHAQALQMPDNNILFIVPDSVVIGQYLRSLRSNNVELCTNKYFDCCGDYNENVNIKRMKNGKAFITWRRINYYTSAPYYTSAAYFTIFDASCSNIILETKIGNTQGDPQIECLENGNCVVFYIKDDAEMVLRVLDFRTNTLGPDIIVSSTSTMDNRISAYSNSNFMLVWTDWAIKSIVGRVYSLDCLEYVGEECQSCGNSKVFSKGKKACVTPIQGCEEYSANGKCTICILPKVLSVRKTSCVELIQGCLEYKYNGECLSCIESHKLIRNNVCARIIAGCVLYSNDGQMCLTCENLKKPIERGLACRNYIIKDCASYSEDNKCQACISPTVLSVEKTACVKPIQACLEYKNNGKCSTCDNNKILSLNKKECFPEVVGCIKYSSDYKCKFCIHGTQLSSDKLSCVGFL